MSDKILNGRLRELEKQLEEIDAAIDQGDSFNVEPVDDIQAAIADKYQQAQTRRGEIQSLIKQDASESQISRVYPAYLRSLNAAESRLQDLQQTLAFLELNRAQLETHQDSLKFTKNVCNELIERCGCSVDFLPVIWDGYATMPIDDNSLYAIYVPRERSRIQGAPILGHEIGHVVYDNIPSRLDSRQQFVEALSSHCEGFQARKRDLVDRVWRDWFVELLCDGCGLITFGPAYLVRMSQRLRKSHPYQLPTKNSVQTHPPAALRWNFVRQLAEDRFPGDIQDCLEPVIEEYETYLQYCKSKPRRYHEWINQELLDHIRAVLDDRLDSDLSLLTAELLDGVAPESVPERRHRLAINKELVQIQKGR